MRIVAIVRTRDEERNIGRFCEAYQDIADEILIADGGSEDDTVPIALTYPKTRVIPFHERVEMRHGHWVNPQGKHVNMLIDHARHAADADWIIFDDCDCVPNFLLREQARGRLLVAMLQRKPAVYVRRVYFWGEDEIFPEMHKPNTGLWAFRSNSGVRADEKDPVHLTIATPHLRPKSEHLEFPFCLLHYTWPTPEYTEKKLRWYRESGVQPGASHPLDFAGPRQPAEWFMREKPPSDS